MVLMSIVVCFVHWRLVCVLLLVVVGGYLRAFLFLLVVAVRVLLLFAVRVRGLLVLFGLLFVVVDRCRCLSRCYCFVVGCCMLLLLIVY